MTTKGKKKIAKLVTEEPEIDDAPEELSRNDAEKAVLKMLDDEERHKSEQAAIKKEKTLKKTAKKTVPTEIIAENSEDNDEIIPAETNGPQHPLALPEGLLQAAALQSVREAEVAEDMKIDAKRILAYHREINAKRHTHFDEPMPRKQRKHLTKKRGNLILKTLPGNDESNISGPAMETMAFASRLLGRDVSRMSADRLRSKEIIGPSLHPFSSGFKRRRV